MSSARRYAKFRLFLRSDLFDYLGTIAVMVIMVGVVASVLF
jgi:hypothetical protein